MIKKKICIVTAGRSDFSILHPLILKFYNSNIFDTYILVTGNHFDKRFGSSINDLRIKKNTFNINYSYKNQNITNISSKILKKSSEIFKKIKPSILIVVGDRYEIFSTTFSAYYNSIPIAHLYGGETSLGSLDNYARHAISNLSSLHFVSNLKSKKLLEKNDENSDYVFNVGSLGIEHIQKNKNINKKTLENKFKFKFNKMNILVAYHPNSIEQHKTKKEITILLNSIKILLDKYSNISFIFTAPNADKNYDIVMREISNFCKRNILCYYVSNFGKNYYPGLLKNIDLIIGNSSSGIIEAHSVKTYTLNIGNRQKNRYQNKSTFNCTFNKVAILKNIIKILNFKNKNSHFKLKNIYEKAQTSEIIFKIINNMLKRKIYFKNL